MSWLTCDHLPSSRGNMQDAIGRDSSDVQAIGQGSNGSSDVQAIGRGSNGRQ